MVALQEAKRLEPDNTDNQLRLGYAMKHQGQLNEAVACFRKVIQLEPGNAQGYAYLGIALANQGKHEEALAGAASRSV